MRIATLALLCAGLLFTASATAAEPPASCKSTVSGDLRLHALESRMGQLVRDTSPLVAMPVKVFVAFGGKEADEPAVNAKVVGLVRTVEANSRAAGALTQRDRGTG